MHINFACLVEFCWCGAGRRRGMGWVVVLDLEVGLWLRSRSGQRTKCMLCCCFTENFRAVIKSQGPGISPSFYERGPWLPS